ncbi:MAG: AAA-like domain-containing protein [Lachnospiraceae bacterium]|nr:AAA-like domain-containing protein [Lachnospiraceae bacterium]
MNTPRKFNTTGVCIPALHYMVDTSSVTKQIIEKYIVPGEYFTINRARQYGKTTTLELLFQQLEKDYIVLDISFEAADEYFQSLKTLAQGLWMDIGDLLLCQNISSVLQEEWRRPLSDDFPLRDLGRRITSFCSKSEKKVILMIDEVDKNADNQIFLTFLGLLREKYLKQKLGKDRTFHSVILAGVYDIKNLKLKMRPEEDSKYNSPWNIAADFNVNMAFSEDGIAGMLSEYEKDYHTGMDTDSMSRMIYAYSSGYPFLVSRLCKLLDEQVAGTEEYPSRSDAWTSNGFQKAVRLLLFENNTLFDDMFKKLDEYKTLSEMLVSILFSGRSISYNPDTEEIAIGVRFGFVKSTNSQVAIANRIFEMRLYNYYLSREDVSNDTYQSAIQAKNQFIHGAVLDVDLILRRFTEHFTDVYASNSDKFIEENGRRLFLLYLRPIINGTGNYYVEARTRSMNRTDIIIDYLGKQYIIETKIWRGNEYNTRGEKQLIGYLDDYHLEKGYMLSFCFNKNKVPGVHEITLGGKILVEAIV